jgi:hypothetical protein
VSSANPGEGPWRPACNPLPSRDSGDGHRAASEGNVTDSEHHRRDEGLREVESETERLARDAQHARDENARGTDRGQETDYAFRLPPDVAEADRVRSDDYVELADRQEQAAETQRRAAETLRRNEEMLQGTARELDRASEAVQENRDDVRDVQQNVEALRAQTNQAREMVDRAAVPDVEGDGNEKGGREDGQQGENG